MIQAKALIRQGLCLWAVAALVGCATVTVRSITNGGPQAAYELEGTRLEKLEMEAKRLCPNGYDTKRQWGYYDHLATDDLFYLRWMRSVGQLFSNPTNDKAQLAIVCLP